MIVEILGTENCPKCNEIKKHFKNTKYTYISIPTDMPVTEFLKRTGSLNVPVVFIDGKQFSYNEVLKMEIVSGN